MKQIFTIALIISSFLFVGCQEESKPEVEKSDTHSFLNADPIVNKRRERPVSLPLIIPSGDNTLAGRILIAKGSEPKPTLIFLHGNPGFEKNEETGQILRRGGYNSVFFSYSGTWGNKGVFGYNKSIEDVRAVVDYLKKNRKQLRVDSLEIYLCGFSMGADIAILSAQTKTHHVEMIEDFTAVIFQHEIDHLNGILYLQHLDNEVNGNVVTP